MAKMDLTLLKFYLIKDMKFMELKEEALQLILVE
jgi:hypothetical protein